MHGLCAGGWQHLKPYCAILICYYLLCTFSCLENTTLQPPSSITPGATTTSSVSVSWSQVLNATGYYVSYQRQDLGVPPVVTPQYERIVGGDNTSVTLSGLQPGTTYRIRVWSTNGASVSREAGEVDVTTVESGEAFCKPEYIHSVTVYSTYCYSHSLLPTTHADHDWRTKWEYC